MISVDADLVLAIHPVKSSLTMPVHCHHVYGHQDTKKKKEKKKEEDEAKASMQPDPIDINKCKPAPEIAAQFHPTPSNTQQLHTDEIYNPARDDYKISFDSNSDSESDTDDESEDGQEIAKPMTTEAMINVRCDMHPSAVTEAAVAGNLANPGPVLSLPYHGSKAMPKIGDTWITSKYLQASDLHSKTNEADEGIL